MRHVRVSFQNQEKVNLQGILDFPVSGKPAAFAIFVHCFTCGKNLRIATFISDQLTLANIAVLRFDFTGLGESEGTFADSNFSSNVADLKSAADFLEEKYSAPEILIGHSLGGLAALAALSQIHSVKAIITIGAPSDATHLTKLFTDQSADIMEQGAAQVSIGGRPFSISSQFLEDLSTNDPLTTLESSRKALLILHAPQDEIVGINHAAVLFDSAHHPKSFISIDHADHLLSNQEDAMYAGSIIATWVSRYLDLKRKVLLETDRQAVVRTGTEKYYTEILTGSHFLVADEPKDVGGQDLGPSPYDLLVSALGACTSMTLRMYADRKEWPLEEIRVHVQHSKEHCEDCNTKDGRIDKITREIEVEGDLTEKQRKRLVEIAERCPVHRTLHGPIEIDTSLR